MDETQWTLVDIIGPAILVVLLLWLVLRTRSRRRPDNIQTDTTAETEQATRANYAAEEQRRRDGADGL